MAAANSPARRLEQELGRVKNADLSEADRGAITAMVENLQKKDATLAAYCRCIRLLGKYADNDLTELNAEEMATVLDETAEAKDWSPKTLAQYQSGAKAFAKFRGLDADAIQVERTSGSSSVDSRTVMTTDDFHALRDAAPNMRDKALVDLLGYTGQRLRVIQSLKIRDVDPDEGVYYMPDADGLKGADKNGEKRPLLGARKSVGDWVEMHPTGEPDDILITALETGSGTPGEEISGQHINARLQKVADRAGVDKPVNAHAFRHFFVTVAKKTYEMEDGTIRHLIGHGDGSRIMETTYQHLNDDDHISAAEKAFGIEEDGEEPESLTPPFCPTCTRPLPPEVQECPTPTCSEVFGPGTVEQDGQDPASMVEGMEKEELLQTIKAIEGKLSGDS